MSKNFEFLITSPRDGILEVRWLVPLGKVKSQVYGALQDELEELHGVESIHVGRYSAEIEVARHVVTEAQLAEEVYETLKDAEQIRSALRFQFMGATMTVVNAVTANAEPHTPSQEGQ